MEVIQRQRTVEGEVQKLRELEDHRDEVIMQRNAEICI